MLPFDGYPVLLRRADVRVILGVCDKTLRALERSGKLVPDFKLGERGRRWSQYAVKQFIEGGCDVKEK
jgi:hypothetical protein